MAGPWYYATIPDEPPVGTVVLDKDDVAWQRISMDEPYPKWVKAQLDSSFTNSNVDYWPKLLTERGPLRELYRPEGEKTDGCHSEGL